MVRGRQRRARVTGRTRCRARGRSTGARAAAGLLSIALSATAAAVVVASMRLIGLLLSSALLVLQAAVAMLWARSFRSSLVLAGVLGAALSVAGTTLSYYADLPSGGMIVLLAVALFVLVSSAQANPRLVG